MRGFATQGTHGADTAVYVDGVPQNIPSIQSIASHGAVFLEWLPPELIGGIDVIKGPVSALYGDQNRAGAVDIRTRDGGDATPSSVSVSAERYGLRRTALVLSNKLSQVDSSWLPTCPATMAIAMHPIPTGRASPGSCPRNRTAENTACA